MGGFALYDSDKSFLRVLDEITLEELDKAGLIEWPTITEKEIQDRSKADIFSKGIVLLQTTWFIISRFATKLAVTELEVVTLAFAMLNGITYWLWWDKPSDVRCTVPVYLKSTEASSHSKVSQARQQRNADVYTPMPPGITRRNSFFGFFKHTFERRREHQGSFLAILYTLLWAPMKVIFGPLGNMLDQDEIPSDDITRVPTFYSPEDSVEVLAQHPSDWTMMVVIVLFGAIHFIPWSSSFPTNAGRWLWRVSAISITGGPLLVIFLFIIDDLVANPSLMNILKFSASFIIVPVYIISRVILLVLPLILLRSLPPTALLELKWCDFFPHI